MLLSPDDLMRYIRREALALLTDSHTPPGAPALPLPKPSPGSTWIGEGRQAGALARALAEWQLAVREPPGEGWERIDDYIRGPEGLGWPSAALAGSSDSVDYRRDGQFQWCGAFAAYAYGATVDAAIRRTHFASCYRLWKWSAGTLRRLAPADLRPGDIAVTGPSPSRGKAWGSHITLVVERTPGGVATVEGNAVGQGPDGRRYQGVIRRERPFIVDDNPKAYRVLYGVRPLVEDCHG